MRPSARGFTLIEMSIVLVIIGLIVGGVLVGQDLIRAAQVRATISQLEKYNTAVNTFRGKYNALPGDIKDPDASNFGFVARGGPGEGDGNGVIEGTWNGPGQLCDFCQQGETVLFWVDLSTAHLIEGNFSSAVASGLPFAPITSTTSPSLSSFFPSAKLGQGNFIYVYAQDSVNYFGISATASLGSSAVMVSGTGLTVSQALALDTKFDDGMPQSGRVVAEYLNYNLENLQSAWASGGGVEGANSSGDPSTAATGGSPTTCYDNGGNAGATQQYSMKQNGGAGLNCALSFRFQ